MNHTPVGMATFAGEMQALPSVSKCTPHSASWAMAAGPALTVARTTSDHTIPHRRPGIFNMRVKAVFGSVTAATPPEPSGMNHW